MPLLRGRHPREMRPRDARARGVAHAEAQRIARVATDRCIDGAGAARHAEHDGPVFAITVRACNWRTRSRLGGERLGDDHQARGVGIQSMHDSRARHVRQRAAQCASRPLSSVPAPVTRRGVHDQSGRLVDHDDMVVLVHERERHRLRAYRLFASGAGGGSTSIRSPSDKFVALANRAAIDADGRVLDPLLEAAARHVGHQSRQGLVQPLAGMTRVDTEAPRERRIAIRVGVVDSPRAERPSPDDILRVLQEDGIRDGSPFRTADRAAGGRGSRRCSRPRCSPAAAGSASTFGSRRPDRQLGRGQIVRRGPRWNWAMAPGRRRATVTRSSSRAIRSAGMRSRR